MVAEIDAYMRHIQQNCVLALKYASSITDDYELTV